MSKLTREQREELARELLSDDDLISRQGAVNTVRNMKQRVDNIDDYEEVLVACFEELIPPRQWIPCSERLPEKDGEYLVTIQDLFADERGVPKIGMANFDVDCEGFGFWQEIFENFGYVDSEWNEIPVVAWQPLPEPYKAEE